MPFKETKMDMMLVLRIRIECSDVDLRLRVLETVISYNSSGKENLPIDHDDSRSSHASKYL